MKSRITSQLIDRMQKLRGEGLSIAIIAMRVGVNDKTVGQILRGVRGASVGPDGRMTNHIKAWERRKHQASFGGVQGGTTGFR